MPLGPAPVEGLMPASLGQEHMTLGDDLSTCHLIDFIDSLIHFWISELSCPRAIAKVSPARAATQQRCIQLSGASEVGAKRENLPKRLAFDDILSRRHVLCVKIWSTQSGAGFCVSQSPECLLVKESFDSKKLHLVGFCDSSFIYNIRYIYIYIYIYTYIYVYCFNGKPLQCDDCQSSVFGVCNL